MPYLIDYKSNVSCIFKQITALLWVEFHFYCPLISFHKILVIHHNLIDHKVLKRNIKIKLGKLIYTVCYRGNIDFQCLFWAHTICIRIERRTMHAKENVVDSYTCIQKGLNTTSNEVRFRWCNN